MGTFHRKAERDGWQGSILISSSGPFGDPGVFLSPSSHRHPYILVHFHFLLKPVQIGFSFYFPNRLASLRSYEFFKRM
jgi:hypothetical protein